MVDLDIFRTSSFANGTVIMTLYFMGMTSVWVLVALYVQDGQGKTALESGFFGIPAALLSASAAHWSGRRVSRYGRKIVIFGLALALFGLAASIAVVLMHEWFGLSVWWLLLSLAFIGLAQGTVISPNQTLTLAEVPLEYAGSSGAIMQTGQRIGTSVGIAMITAAVFATLARWSWSIAVIVGFGLVALVVLAALAMAFKDQRDRQRSARERIRSQRGQRQPVDRGESHFQRGSRWRSVPQSTGKASAASAHDPGNSSPMTIPPTRIPGKAGFARYRVSCWLTSGGRQDQHRETCHDECLHGSCRRQQRFDISAHFSAVSQE